MAEEGEAVGTSTVLPRAVIAGSLVPFALPNYHQAQSADTTRNVPFGPRGLAANALGWLS